MYQRIESKLVVRCRFRPMGTANHCGSWSSLGFTIATDAEIGWEKSTATEQASRLRSAAKARDRSQTRSSPLGVFLLFYYNHNILSDDGSAPKTGQKISSQRQEEHLAIRDGPQGR